MLTALIAFALQAAAAAPAPPDAVSRSGHAWAVCVKGRVDAGLRSSQAAEALADAAIAGCAAELEAIRAAIEADSNAEIAALNVERVRGGTKQTLIAYVARERGAGASPPQAQ